MAKLYRRSDFAFTWDSTNSRFAPIAGGFVTTYDVGAVVNATQSGVTSVTVYPGNGFAATDYFLYCASTSSISTSRVFDVSAVSAAAAQDTITFTAPIASFDAGSYLLNLGADSTGAYTGSTITTYSGPDTAFTANTNSTVTISAGGTYEYWWNGAPAWELIRNSAGTPVLINFVPRMFEGTLDQGALVVSSNTIIPRWNYHTIDTSGGAQTITTITATGVHVGFILTLKSSTTTAANFNSGGNLKLSGNQIVDNNDVLQLVYDGTNWCQVAYTSNA